MLCLELPNYIAETASYPDPPFGSIVRLRLFLLIFFLSTALSKMRLSGLRKASPPMLGVWRPDECFLCLVSLSFVTRVFYFLSYQLGESPLVIE